MKKLITFLLAGLFLSSCAMHPTRVSDQQIFYGESLVEYDSPKKSDLKNTSFIYNEEISDED